MGLFDPIKLEWWLPTGYITVIVLVEVVRKLLGASDSDSNKHSDDETVLEAQNGTLRAPLLETSGGKQHECKYQCNIPLHYASDPGSWEDRHTVLVVRKVAVVV